jgi:hypothetical protein
MREYSSLGHVELVRDYEQNDKSSFFTCLILRLSRKGQKRPNYDSYLTVPQNLQTVDR